jgi:hypothetical protein
MEKSFNRLNREKMEKKSLSVISLLLTLIPATLFFYACLPKSSSDLTVEVSNPTDNSFIDVAIRLDDPEFIKKINTPELANFVVKAGEKLLPFQLIDNEKDGNIDQLLVLCNINKQEKYKIKIVPGTEEKPVFIKRTQAELSVKEGGKWEMVTKENGSRQFEYIGGIFKNIEKLRVPDEHTDHSFYIRYEGPGWESDKVGYRFYLDWRNATDIFGKKTTDMVLQNVGQDGFDSYHEESDWGMDILKVGESLGIGSIGYWNGKKALRVADTDSIICEIRQNGVIQSEIVTTYYGWNDAGKNLNLISRISIQAGSRLSLENIVLSEDIENICTGIVKHDSTQVLSSSTNSEEWSYMATYGKQSLNNDYLGMVIFYKNSDLIEIQEDEYSHVLVLKPHNKTLDYYFGAVWAEDPDKISTQQLFLEYLNATLFQLNNPVIVNY